MAYPDMNLKEMTRKWQKRWEEAKVFEAKESKKKKFYVLEMFPYPSASGLHMGHALNYTIGDIYARFKRMQGYNVLYTMGFDSFGLPAENAAIKEKSHPKKFTESAIKNYVKQMRELGISYDWSRTVSTHKPDFYRWDQWIFLKMHEKGLAYKKKAPVNWCPKCNTVLANEQVHDGKCWRHESTDVEVKHLEQWFLKTTAYAGELYDNLDRMDGWPDLIKTLQRNWIGKSEGTEVAFKINDEDWKIFTTRPDTLFGVTFMVISAQHPRLSEIVTKEQKKDVEKFLKKVKSTKEEDMISLEKEGVFTGSYATHPLTGEKVPVWAGNFVVADYGSGVVMAVPAHDQRDFEFAKKYKILIKQVVAPTFITTSGPDAVRKDKKTVERNSVFGIVKHWSEDKYLCLDWKKFGWKSFIIGGIEENENPEDAIRREVKEETGYRDIKSIKPIDTEVIASFFAKHKDENRQGRYKTFLVELGSDKYTKPKESEVVNHDAAWIKKADVAKFLNLNNNTFLWDIYTKGERAFTESGTSINSEKFSGIDSEKAKSAITKELEKKKLGKKTVNYRLRDWLISRQRFWGTPIPIIYCDKCGTVPVPEKDLPVILPEDVKFSDVKNPLIDYKPFTETKCPKCNGKARRETDTMDTFVNSSWYFLRYTDAKNEKEIFDAKKANYWCPVDQYIGGKEHACMHLIYSRFYVKFLRDIGLLKFDEPATKLFNQGMLLGPDGEKMSKSKGNIVLPEVVSEKYGIDTARLFLVSVASPDKDIQWSDQGVEGALRLVRKIFSNISEAKIGRSSKKLESRLHKMIKDVTDDIENMKYNLAIIKIREFVESMGEEVSKEDLNSFIKILAPFAPHVAEELWEMNGNKGFVSTAEWPEHDEKKIDEKLEVLEELNERLRKDIMDVLSLLRLEKPKEIKIIIAEPWKYELAEKYKRITEKTRDMKEIIAEIMKTDLKKHGQEVMRIIHAYTKDASKLPAEKLTQKEEEKNINDYKERLESEFSSRIIVEKAESSKEPKARNALPGKPAIIIS